MDEFKVGDRVKVTNKAKEPFWFGAEGVLRHIDICSYTGERILFIVFDPTTLTNKFKDKNLSELGFYASSCTKIKLKEPNPSINEYKRNAMYGLF